MALDENPLLESPVGSFGFGQKKKLISNQDAAGFTTPPAAPTPAPPEGARLGHLTAIPGSGLDTAIKAVQGFKERYNAPSTAPKIISPDNPVSMRVFTPPSADITATTASAAPKPQIINPADPASMKITPPSAGVTPASSLASPTSVGAPAGGAASPSPGSYMGSFADAKPSMVIGEFNGRDITKQQAVELDQRLPTSAAGWPVIAGPNGGVAFTPSTKVGPAAQAGASAGGPLNTPSAPVTASVPASTPTPVTPAAATPTTAGNAAPGPLAAPAPTFAANLSGQDGGLGGGGLGGGGGGGLGGSPPQVDTKGMREAEAERAEARSLLERQRGLMELRSQGMNSRGKRQLYAELTGQSMDLTKQRGNIAAADVASQRQAASAAGAQVGANQRNTADNQTQRDLMDKKIQAQGILPPTYQETVGGGLSRVAGGIATPVTDALGQPIKVPQRQQSGVDSAVVAAYNAQLKAIADSTPYGQQADLTALNASPLGQAYAAQFAGFAGTGGPIAAPRPTPVITADAIATIRANPDLAEPFDQKYGKGSAARYLGGNQ